MQKIPQGGLTQPLYTISAASDLTNVSPVMIREYEKAGLINPPRVRGKRRFTPLDVANIRLIRYYLSDRQMTLNGFKVLLQSSPCFAIKQCSAPKCPAASNGKSCFESAAENPACDQRFCKHCPIYLVRTRGKVAPPFTSELPRVFA